MAQTSKDTIHANNLKREKDQYEKAAVESNLPELAHSALLNEKAPFHYMYIKIRFRRFSAIVLIPKKSPSHFIYRRRLIIISTCSLYNNTRVLLHSQ